MKKYLFLAIISTGVMSIVTGCAMPGQNILPSIGEQYAPQHQKRIIFLVLLLI